MEPIVGLAAATTANWRTLEFLENTRRGTDLWRRGAGPLEPGNFRSFVQLKRTGAAGATDEEI